MWQPSPDLFLKEYEKAKQNREDVLVLTISGGKGKGETFRKETEERYNLPECRHMQ